MEPVGTISNASECSRILAIDKPEKCELCSHGGSSDAHRNITDLCHWWLGATQRQQWYVRTTVRTLQRSDKEATDAIFQIEIDVPDRRVQIPVFLAITQHSLPARRKHLHYQLQIPCRGELKTAARLANLERAVVRLADQASARVEGLRGKHRSISLHEPLGPSGLHTIQEAVSDLVVGLRKLEWGAV